MSKFQLDNAAYTNLLDGLNNLYFTDIRGDSADFSFYYNDDWLSDSAVIDKLTYCRGEWTVELVFAYTLNPIQFIKRAITSHPCPKRAAQKAYFMRRLAAKDQRGTLTVSSERMSICPN